MGGRGDQIAQASKIRIVTEIPLPMQVDGEPVMLLPCEILIEKKNQANMLLAAEDPSLTLTDITTGVC